MKKILTIDVVFFKEGKQYHAFSPQLVLVSNSSKKADALTGLETMCKMQLDYFKEHKTLENKIETLGLGRIPRAKRNSINKGLNVPYDVLRLGFTLGKISLQVEL